MIHKDLFRRFLTGFYALGFSALLVGLTRYFYLAKEILVCWLLFCSVFAVLALIIFGVMLGTVAGQYLLKMLSVAKLVIADLVAALVAAPQRSRAVPSILAAATHKFPAGSCNSVVPLESGSYLLIESTHMPEETLSERDVQNCTDRVLYTS